jgi:hypothetical protein
MPVRLIFNLIILEGAIPCHIRKKDNWLNHQKGGNTWGSFLNDIFGNVKEELKERKLTKKYQRIKTTHQQQLYAIAAFGVNEMCC